jgi:hypothetical protein
MLTPPEPDPVPGLSDLPLRMHAALPFLVDQGHVEGWRGKDGRWHEYLRVRLPSTTGRRRYVSFALGSDPRRCQQVRQTLEAYRAMHKAAPPDRTPQLQQALKKRAEREARKILKHLAPARAAFRQAWREMKAHGVPLNLAKTVSYAKLIAMQIPAATRGRPAKACFARPAAPFHVRPFNDVDLRECVLATILTAVPVKANRWNPRQPLRPEDYFLPGGFAGLAALKPVLPDLTRFYKQPGPL